MKIPHFRFILFNLKNFGRMVTSFFKFLNRKKIQSIFISDSRKRIPLTNVIPGNIQRQSKRSALRGASSTYNQGA